MLESVLAILPTLVTLVTAASDTPFDFGLFENEPILRQVLKEDLELTTDLETLNSQYKDEFQNGEHTFVVIIAMQVKLLLKCGTFADFNSENRRKCFR